MIDKNVAELKAKGMIFNEVKGHHRIPKACAGVWKEFEPIVGKDLIDAIVNTK